MCESMSSFLGVFSWSVVTVDIVVLIVRLLLVCSNDMGGLEYVHCMGFIPCVVGLLQIVLLINEAFPFDLMLCHGVHSFPHWMTR